MRGFVGLHETAALGVESLCADLRVNRVAYLHPALERRLQAVALGVLFAARVELVPKLAATLAFVPFHANEPVLAGQCLAVGAAVGFIAAWFSVGRYLRV